ncbi:hypothetical protein SASPL_143052 [Salvia splendens]|uniref:Uncharacterized protein n=1 Tax=Salvia splendens TaxID=180675 RepID=A0A8X8WMW3_SALSN|nr:hypothetical protein SASPL_143052 [Salvia splendens]
MEADYSSDDQITSPLLRQSDEVEVENSPIKQVALTVSTSDDPSLPRADVQNVVAGDAVVCAPLLPEPVLLVQDGAPLHHRHLRADRGGAAGAADGSQDHGPCLL